MNISAFENIIENFKGIPPTKPFLPSFMDISGYPHYENVCSNILSFYFQTGEAHNLKDMLLRALFKSCDYESEDIIIGETKTQRETITETNNRIDIFIETENLNIGIENKIYQDVYNDLGDYSNYIEKNSKGKKTLKIVLSLYKTENIKLQKSGFINVTYSKLFSKIEEVIGNYLLEANQKYISYLMDFVNTIKRLERGTTMNKEFLDFLSANEEHINRLLNEVTKTRKELRMKLQDLSKSIDAEGLSNVIQSYYREPSSGLFDTLVHDIVVNNELRIAIDTIITPSGWYFDVFARPKLSNNFDEFIESRNIVLVDSYDYGRKRLDIEYKYDDNLENIVKTLQGLIDKISK